MKDRARKGTAKVSDEFVKFCDFMELMGPKPSREHTLDRLDPHNPIYSRDNCRWADKREQSNNRRNTTYLNFDGDVRPLADWSRLTGVAPDTIRRRLALGWSDREAIVGERSEPPLPTVSDTPPATGVVEWLARRGVRSGSYPKNEPLMYALYRAAHAIIDISFGEHVRRGDLSPRWQAWVLEAQQILRDIGRLVTATAKGRAFAKELASRGSIKDRLIERGCS